MPNPQDEDIIAFEAIADQIGPEDRQFTVVPSDGPPVLGIIGEAFGSSQYAFAHALRG
jgi:hypothetical protein